MSWLTIVLRVLHIGGGVFWAGGMFLLAGFVEPVAAAAGPEGGRFMGRLAGRFTPVTIVVGVVTLVAGIWLLWRDSGGFQAAFMGSGTGVALSVGTLSGLAAAVVGIGVGARNALRLRALGGAIQGQAGGPTPEQLGQVQALQRRLRLGARVTALLLAVTVVCMAVARYV
jgi:uncharacterized membrane protein